MAVAGGKSEVRFLGIDDGPFERGDRSTRLVAVVTRGASYVEGVLSSRIRVDGTDATKKIMTMVAASRFRPLLRCIFLNGLFVGGFNMVDIPAIHEGTGIPVVALTRSAPRPERVRAALAAAFGPKGTTRWERAARTPLQPLQVGLHAAVSGCTLRQAAAWTHQARVRGNIPECLRLAHVIAAGIDRGESRGRA